MNPGLVMSLGKFFGIESLLICLDYDKNPPGRLQDGISATTMPWPVKYFLPEDLDGIRDHLHNAIVLIACENVNFTTSGTQLTKADFEPNIIWLIPSSTQEMAAKNLPLTLNSNVLLYTGDKENNATVISEVYSVKSHYRTNIFAQWSEDAGLTVPQPAVWERRKDLGGVTLVSTALHFNPMNRMGPNNTVTGLFPDILYALHDSLNFR